MILILRFVLSNSAIIRTQNTRPLVTVGLFLKTEIYFHRLIVSICNDLAEFIVTATVHKGMAQSFIITYPRRRRLAELARQISLLQSTNKHSGGFEQNINLFVVIAERSTRN